METRFSFARLQPERFGSLRQIDLEMNSRRSPINLHTMDVECHFNLVSEY